MRSESVVCPECGHSMNPLNSNNGDPHKQLDSLLDDSQETLIECEGCGAKLSVTFAPILMWETEVSDES